MFDTPHGLMVPNGADVRYGCHGNRLSAVLAGGGGGTTMNTTQNMR